MNVGNDIGTSEGKNIAVVEEVFFVAFELLATSVGFGEFVTANGGAHRAIEDEDAFGEGFFEFWSRVGLHINGVVTL